MSTALTRCRGVVRRIPMLVPKRTLAAAAEYRSPIQDYITEMETGLTAMGSREYVPQPSRVLECGVPEDVLRFSTTAYGRLLQAPHVHPNEHKVTLKLRLVHLPLNELELDLLREIVGPRVREQELILSSDQFASRIENKRHLVSMLNRLVFSAKRLAMEIEEAA